MNNETIRKRLFEMQDLRYKAFHSRLMPSVDPELIIGVRIPDLRRLAKEINGTPEAEFFLQSLPHKYYEENNLHAFLIENIRSFNDCVKAVNSFLPYIDNWATCDSLRPKVFKKNPASLEKQAFDWIESEKTYTVRFGIECLMVYFLDGQFNHAHAEKVAAVNCSEYYVSMMVAWYFATALAKHYNETLPYIEKRVLDPETHKRTIQKAIDSYRIDESQKAFLNTLK